MGRPYTHESLDGESKEDLEVWWFKLQELVRRLCVNQTRTVGKPDAHCTHTAGEPYAHRERVKQAPCAHQMGTARALSLSGADEG